MSTLHEMVPGKLWQGSVIDGVFDAAEIVLTCSPETEVLTAFRIRPLHLLFVFADAAELPDMELAHQVAQLLAHEVGLGRKTLVHCTAGKNRSGLMTALVLYHLGIAKGAALVEYVRARNPRAFTVPGEGGPFFADYVRGLA